MLVAIIGVGYPSSRACTLEVVLHSGWKLIPRFVSFCFRCSGVALSVPTFTDLFHNDLNDLHVFILLYFPDCLVRVALCFSSAK